MPSLLRMTLIKVVHLLYSFLFFNINFISSLYLACILDRSGLLPSCPALASYHDYFIIVNTCSCLNHKHSMTTYSLYYMHTLVVQDKDNYCGKAGISCIDNCM